VERALGLMCGAGVLPVRMAAEARRRGWRVIAFTFAADGELGAHVERVIPSRTSELGAVLAAIGSEGISATLFSGKFWMANLLSDEGRDGATREIHRRAGSLRDADLTGVIVATLAGLGVEVLDQRDFVGDWLVTTGVCTARGPSDLERQDIRHGFELTHRIASARVGQTVVLRHGLVTAVEAVEGTTEAIRRGARLAGPGAVVVKAVAGDHDYRFDAPAIGPDTIAAAVEGGVAVIALETGKIMLVDRETSIRRADEAGIALVAVNAWAS